MEPRRHDVAREHRVEKARGRGDPERVGREEEALGIVRDDGDFREESRERFRAGCVQREGRRVAAGQRHRRRERRRRPRRAGAALDVNRCAARLHGGRDERVEARSACDPAHALRGGV